jgi:putative tryptophan/tyrosine transport system substrate-binding protein
MKRREFIAGLGAVAWPLAARGQKATVPVIGFLDSGAPDPMASRVAAFRKGLSESGFVEDRNVAIEYRWANYDSARLQELAAELVRSRVAVIFTSAGTPAPLAAKAATTTVPIVFVNGLDPIQTGLVASLNRPGGNLTGLTILNSELVSKRLGLLHELVPGARRIVVLENASLPGNEAVLVALHQTASAFGAQIEDFSPNTIDDIDATFASMVQKGADALILRPHPLFFDRRSQIVELAARNALPAIYYNRRFTEAGGLVSYATDELDPFRQAGLYVARILKGEKPSDLPVMQPTKFELVINLKTTKALGLTIPPIRTGPCRYVSCGWNLHWPYPQGRKAGRSSDCAAD